MYNVNFQTDDRDYAVGLMEKITRDIKNDFVDGNSNCSLHKIKDDKNGCECAVNYTGKINIFKCCDCEKNESEFDFGTAIQIMKQGGKVSRKGWNGKTQYIELASNISYTNADEYVVNCEHDAIGNKAIAFVGTSGVQIGWLASQADILAEDWCIHVDEDKKEPWDDFCF